MKREELSKIKVEGLENGLPKEVIDEIMNLYGKSVEENKRELETVKTEKESLSTQLNEANTKIKNFSDLNIDEIKKEVENWKTKYETDTKKLQDDLTQQQYSYKINDLAKDLHFSSESAKKSFINDLKEKQLKLENDKLLGYDDFVKEYKESDPNAFKNEEANSGIVSTGDSHEKDTSEEDAFINKVMGLK